MVETFTVGGKKYITISKREGDKVRVTDFGKARLKAARAGYTSSKGIVAPKPSQFYLNPETGKYSTTSIAGAEGVSRVEALKRQPIKAKIQRQVIDKQREQKLSEQQKRVARALTEDAQEKRFGGVIYKDSRKQTVVPKKVSRETSYDKYIQKYDKPGVTVVPKNKDSEKTKDSRKSTVGPRRATKDLIGDTSYSAPSKSYDTSDVGQWGIQKNIAMGGETFGVSTVPTAYVQSGIKGKDLSLAPGYAGPSMAYDKQGISQIQTEVPAPIVVERFGGGMIPMVSAKDDYVVPTIDEKQFYSPKKDSTDPDMFGGIDYTEAKKESFLSDLGKSIGKAIKTIIYPLSGVIPSQKLPEEKVKTSVVYPEGYVSPERYEIENKIEELRNRAQNENIAKTLKIKEDEITNNYNIKSEEIKHNYDSGKVSYEDANIMHNNLFKQSTQELKSIEGLQKTKLDEFTNRQTEIDKLNQKWTDKYEGKEGIMLSKQGISFPRSFLANQQKELDVITNEQRKLNQDIVFSGFSTDVTPDEYIINKKQELIDIALHKKEVKGIVDYSSKGQLEYFEEGLRKTRDAPMSLKELPYKIVYGSTKDVAYPVMKGISKGGEGLEGLGKKTGWKSVERFGQAIKEKPITTAGIAGVSTLTVAPFFGAGSAWLAGRAGVTAASTLGPKATLFGLTLAETGLEAAGVTKVAKKILTPKGTVLTKQEFEIAYKSSDFNRIVINKLKEKGYQGQELVDAYGKEKDKMQARYLAQIAPQVGIGVASERLGRILTKGLTPTQIIKQGSLGRYANPFKVFKTSLGKQIGAAGFVEGATQEVIEATAEDRKISPLGYVGLGAGGAVIAGSIGGVIGRSAVAVKRGERGIGKVVSTVAHVLDPYEKWSDEIADAAAGLAGRLKIRVFKTKAGVGIIQVDNTKEKLLKLKSSYLNAINPNEQQAALNLYIKLGGNPENLVLKEKFAPVKTKELEVQPIVKTKDIIPVTDMVPVVPTKDIVEIPKGVVSKVSVSPMVPATVPTSVPVSITIPTTVPATVPTTVPAMIPATVPVTSQVPVSTQIEKMVPVVPFGVPFAPFGALPGRPRGYKPGVGSRETTVVNPLADLWSPFIKKQRGKTMYDYTGMFKPKEEILLEQQYTMPQMQQQTKMQYKMPQQLGVAALPSLTGKVGVNMMPQQMPQQQFMYGQQLTLTQLKQLQRENNKVKTQQSFDRMLGQNQGNFERQYGKEITGRSGVKTEFGNYGVNKRLVQNIQPKNTINRVLIPVKKTVKTKKKGKKK